MNQIRLPQQRRAGHLTLFRQERALEVHQFNALSAVEQLPIIQQAQGKEKYSLLINSPHCVQLVPQLHPQELYLTINAVGAESAIELLSLTTAEQITLLLDLDCWEKDRLSPTLSLHWLEMLLNTDETTICRLIRELDPELLALMLKKHLRISHGIEVFDDDDVDNAKRLESLYDVEYASEPAGKVIGGLLKIWQEQEQGSYLLVMEMLRNESLAVLEEEVYQARQGRMLDLGLMPELEARTLYSHQNPERFRSGGKPDVRLEIQDLPQPDAMLAMAEPNHLLAEIFAGGIDQDTAHELVYLFNRKISADKIDLSDQQQTRAALQDCYDLLNLALEFLAEREAADSREIFSTTYLLHLFQLGHSLIQQRQAKARQISSGVLYPYLDHPELLFIDALQETPPAFYRTAAGDHPSTIQPIKTLKDLRLIDQRLDQVEALKDLFVEQLKFPLEPADSESDEIPTLAQLLITATANQFIGRDFDPQPLYPADLDWLATRTLINRRLDDSFRDHFSHFIRQRTNSCDFFIAFCLELWEESLLAETSGSDEPAHYGFLLQ